VRDDWTCTRLLVLQAIGIFLSVHGYGPSIRDIARMTGITSTAHIHFLLNGLVAEGRITRERYVARSIRLVEGQA
jgi:SOS-response transcriptional repressor LexA